MKFTTLLVKAAPVALVTAQARPQVSVFFIACVLVLVLVLVPCIFLYRFMPIRKMGQEWRNTWGRMGRGESILKATMEGQERGTVVTILDV